MKFFMIIGSAVLIAAVVFFGRNAVFPSNYSRDGSSTTTSSVRFVTSTITADGTVTAQNQARLNFQLSGKLVSLPFREGDAISAGQTIAQLDTYQLQRQLTAALNSYRSVRDTFDQTQTNAQQGVLRAQQLTPYDYFYKGGLADSTHDTAINDAIRRLLDQSQASLDNSVIQVELANYALQLSRLTSPLTGIVTHQDVAVSGVNITPATAFTVADPETMVFRASIPAEQVYYIPEGSAVMLAIDGVQNKIPGTVMRIYPAKVTLPNGQGVYQADIQSDELKQSAKLDMAGKAIISTNARNVALVPAWTVIGGKFIWIDKNGTPELREVTAGKIHGTEIEITGGLSAEDRIIINPKSIPEKYYRML